MITGLTMGAVLSIRIANNIAQVLSVMTITFWTDSTRRQVQIFCGQSSERNPENDRPKQWRHVPGKENPRDLPTRGHGVILLKI
jgi:hypothetical protein